MREILEFLNEVNEMKGEHEVLESAGLLEELETDSHTKCLGKMSFLLLIYLACTNKDVSCRKLTSCTFWSLINAS